MKQDVEPMVDHHAAIHPDTEWNAVGPSAQKAIGRYKHKANRRNHKKWEADEQFLWIFSDFEGVVLVIVVNAMMLALAVGVERLFAASHFIMPPAVSQVVAQGPEAPSRGKID